MQVKAYKGFNKDMTCRGFQYEEGMEYTFEGDIKLCERGFHACEAPMDVFFFYAPATSVFHEVEVDEVSNEREGDSKIVARKIRIGKRLSVQDLCRAQIEYISMHTTSKATDEKSATAVDCGSATAGDCGAATAGDCGSATAGDRGAATAGDRGAATAGNYGAATVGDRGTATAGYRGAATAGDCGSATAGDRGAATAGDRGAATAGNYGAATVGDRGTATAGYRGAATAGDCGSATAGYRGAATAGDCGAATSMGESSVGGNGVAVARSSKAKAKGGLGAILVLAIEEHLSHKLIDWKAVVVDGKTVLPDTWYTLRDGELVIADA